MTTTPPGLGTVPDMPERVLILGGGFAGIGAARKLKDADADVVLVDQHDYHTFQPLLYQVATDLLETGRGRPSAPRPVPRPAERHRPPGDRRRRSTCRCAAGAFAEMDADHLRPSRARARARASTSSASTGAARARVPALHAGRTPSASRSTCSSAGRRPTATRTLMDDGALNVVIVGGGPTGIESAGALAELYRSELREGLPARCPQDRSAADPGRGRARRCSRCSRRTSAPTRARRSRSAASR